MGKKATLKNLKHKYNKLLKNGRTSKNVIKNN
jgi:hypothetical protein